MAETVPEEVHGAALPGAAQDLGDRRPQSGVGVADRQPDADQAALDQAAQELSPKRLGLGLTDIDRKDLAPAGLMHAMAITSALLTTRPPSRTFSTLASRNT